MAIINAAQATVKTVSDPNASYESLKPLWNKSRAICSGERFVKDIDSLVSTGNMLIPFSPSMSQQQYDFYKAEAELPGITSQFAKMLVGGLLRKQPILKLPDSVPPEIHSWIINEFSQDDLPMSAFLDEALWEEVQTSRAWILVDYPEIEDSGDLTTADFQKYKPYPILFQADSIINWQTKHDSTGKQILTKLLVRGVHEDFSNNEFHPEYIDRVYVHEINEFGNYQIRVYQKPSLETKVPVSSGKQIIENKSEKIAYELIGIKDSILFNGKPLDFIPAWPLNGKIGTSEPMLMPIIDKEISLYNKISRRNHLLYGASTYTPILISDMSDEEFDNIVSAGLGSWIRLRQGDDAKVLETPTAALSDMDRAIAATIEEMAKLGIRMLTPEAAQSGVALEIRNAAQTAQLGTLNMKASNILKQIIVFMINWRYDLNLSNSDVEFSLSSDFAPVSAGPDWLRLATEWYQQGLIPRSAWLVLLKQNDVLPPDYNDEEGRQEITADMEMTMAMQGSSDFANNISANGA